jgi:holo-[acyl-carrier protein] synthase
VTPSGGSSAISGVPLLGIDIVHIPRLRAMLDGPAAQVFLDEAWTRQEQDDCAGRPSSLAMTWAAKEATMKALGVGINSVPLLDIEVLRVAGRPPALRLTGVAAEHAENLGSPALAVSMSQDADTAAAAVFGYGQ